MARALNPTSPPSGSQGLGLTTVFPHPATGEPSPHFQPRSGTTVSIYLSAAADHRIVHSLSPTCIAAEETKSASSDDDNEYLDIVSRMLDPLGYK